MSLGHNTSVVRDGLVFYVDSNNIQKSFKGKPTTNLQLPNIIDWTGSAGVALQSEMSPIGTPVYTVTDDNSGSYLARGRSITVPNDSATYTYSIYVKKTYGATSAMLGFNYGITGGTAVTYNSRFNSDTGAGGSGVVDLGNWWRWWFQAVNNSTGNTTLYCDFYPATGLHGGGDNATATGVATVSSVMIEASTFMTPFVSSTRSNTQVLLDLTSNKTVTAGSLTYASNNTFSFNGSSDYYVFDTPCVNGAPHTVIQWAKPSVALSPVSGDSTNRKTTIVGPGPVWNPGIWVTSDKIRVHAQGEYRDTTISWSDTTYRMIGQVYDGVNCYIIYNGTILTGTRTAYTPGIPTQLVVGSDAAGSSSFTWNGPIDITQIYNRALTATEIMQNFNATRGRFGL